MPQIRQRGDTERRKRSLLLKPGRRRGIEKRLRSQPCSPGGRADRQVKGSCVDSGAVAAGRLHRSNHSPGRRGADPDRGGQFAGPGDQALQRGLSCLCGLRRVTGNGRAYLYKRQSPASVGMQRHGNAAGPRKDRTDVSAVDNRKVSGSGRRDPGLRKDVRARSRNQKGFGERLDDGIPGSHSLGARRHGYGRRH